MRGFRHIKEGEKEKNEKLRAMRGRRKKMNKKILKGAATLSIAAAASLAGAYALKKADMAGKRKALDSGTSANLIYVLFPPIKEGPKDKVALGAQREPHGLPGHKRERHPRRRG